MTNRPQDDQWPDSKTEAQAPIEPDQDTPLDCLIVGGGPAGLTAAIYLARFKRRVAVIDRGDGRLRMIPVSHNHAGYPLGVVGVDLLKNMALQAEEYEAKLLDGEVTHVVRKGDLFQTESSVGSFRSRTVLLATGVVNHRPPLTDEVHDDAVQRGLLRYCPICDAFEQAGKRIGVLGGDRHGLAEALFLRTYSPDISLLSLSGETLDDDARQQADAAGIRQIEPTVSGYDFTGDCVTITLANGESVIFDTLYAALGSHTRNDLGEGLGTKLVDGECFAVDEDQRTSAKGVYAAGDAVEGLDQISVAMGTGARAAVTIHNDLREIDDQTLD